MIGAGVAGAGGQDDATKSGGSRMSMNGDAVNVGKNKPSIGGSPEMAYPGDGNVSPGTSYHTGNNSMSTPHAQQRMMHYDRCACHATQDGEKMINK